MKEDITLQNATSIHSYTGKRGSGMSTTGGVVWRLVGPTIVFGSYRIWISVHRLPKLTVFIISSKQKR